MRVCVVHCVVVVGMVMVIVDS
nr:hypothetical protein [Tanacetum cinerariifolium]